MMHFLKLKVWKNDAARLRRNIITYKRRIKSLIEEQSSIIDDLDKVDID